MSHPVPRHIATAILVAGTMSFPAVKQRAAGQSACPPIDTTAPWARVNQAWQNESGLRWSNDSLRHALLNLRDRDQADRANFGARAGDTVYLRKLMALDSALSAEMKVILDRYGLPTRGMVGAKGADAAMLVVQHSATLQERVLAMAKALPPGQIAPEKLGMLEDRVRNHQGLPQRFGTQFTLRPDGQFVFAPAADTARLDQLREQAGMMPLLQYVCLLESTGARVDRSTLPPRYRNQIR